MSWPLAFAMMAGAVTHICNRFFLAHCGDAALEAVLPAEMLSSLLGGALSATIGYSATFVAQFHGGGKPHAAVGAFAQGLWLVLFSVPLLLLFIPLGNWVVDSCGTDTSIRTAEKAYFAICAPAGLVGAFNCVLTGILTGQGRTRYAGFSTVAGTLLSLMLDPLFIFALNQGIRGAAFATACGSLFTALLLTVAVVRDPLVRTGFTSGDFMLRPAVCANILRFGFPLGLCSLVNGLSFTAFNFLVARCTALELAVSNSVFAVNNVFYLVASAVGQGVTILAGRYHGAGRDDAARTVFRSGLVLTACTLVLYFATILPSAGVVMDLFRGASSTFDPQAFRRCGLGLFMILFFRELAEGTLLVASSALRGVGDTKFVMRVQTAVGLLVRIPLIFAAAALSDSVYLLWLTMPVDMGLTAVLLVSRWRSGRRTAIHL